MNVRRATHNLWFIAQPSDVPGDWETHCLNFDLVAQGRSLLEALGLVSEAACIHVRRMLEEKRDPNERQAPAEFWELRDLAVSQGEKVPLAEILGESVHPDPGFFGVFNFSVVVDLNFEVIDGGDPCEPASTRFERDLVWKKAA